MKDIEKYKTKLLEEKVKLEGELSTVGRKNPKNQADWEPIENDLNTDTADDQDVADAMENFETNTAILNSLELRLKDVSDALDKIENGKYGVCEVGGEVIEEDRLEVNPASRTCKAHM